MGNIRMEKVLDFTWLCEYSRVTLSRIPYLLKCKLFVALNVEDDRVCGGRCLHLSIVFFQSQ